MCSITLLDHLRAVVDEFRPLKTHLCIEDLRAELHKSTVLAIASTLLALKAENIL